MPKLRTMLIAAAILTSAGAGTAWAFSGLFQAATAEPDGRPLTAGEIRSMYAGKTWMWKSGGGYFASNGRFISSSGSGQSASEVEGGWGAYRDGRVCFSGTWKSASGDGFDVTCFQHKRVGGTIYQRRLPAGGWYIFKHARTRSSDEFRKLRPGKHV